MTNNNEYKTCDKCCYDILDDEGDVMDHECISDNEMIAEFMGLQFSKGEYYRPLYNSGDWISENELQYHDSWDWLMPVANEIIKSRDEQNADWDLTDLKYALCTTNIEYVYKAVVEFIKQYNDGQG
jgi:hypothetical protein